jgi:hypothetical protein
MEQLKAKAWDILQNIQYLQGEYQKILQEIAKAQTKETTEENKEGKE